MPYDYIASNFLCCHAYSSHCQPSKIRRMKLFVPNRNTFLHSLTKSEMRVDINAPSLAVQANPAVNLVDKWSHPCRPVLPGPGGVSVVAVSARVPSLASCAAPPPLVSILPPKKASPPTATLAPPV